MIFSKQTLLSISVGFLLLISVLVSGCAELLGTLRKDLDYSEMDQPTVGGVWPEGELLRQPYQGEQRVGHSDWTQASRGNPPKEWVDGGQQANNSRDAYRAPARGPMYSNLRNLPPTTQHYYRATADDFVDKTQDEASLWASDGQTNYFFTKNRIRDVGDVVTMTMEDDLVRDVGSEIKKTLTEPEREMELAAAQAKLQQAAAGDKKDRQPAAADAAKPPEVEVREANYADIDVKDRINVKSGDPMMVEIVQRFPNGNYKIRGTKRVPYLGTLRNLAFVGIAKGSDIDDKDTIPSGKLYEYRLKVYR